MTDDKWIKFSNRILRIRDIDNFEVNVLGLKCNYHLGISYEFLEERFEKHEELQLRLGEIESILGLPYVLL